MKMYINGNEAIAHGARLARPGVISAYPITPQTVIVEKLAEFIGNGELNAQYIKVESEHTALAAAFGSGATGVRPFTATSSQGLLYMQEILHYVSGARIPVVMAVINRAVSPPWTIFLDHQDTIQARDTGWIQLYVENAQEAMDTTIQAFKIAEDHSISTPIMVCADAFVLSHTTELVDVPEQEAVDSFLPMYKPKYLLDVDNPLTLCVGSPPNIYMEFKVRQQRAIKSSIEKIKTVAEEFGKSFGRYWPGVLERYGSENAEAVLIATGSLCGTIKDAVDELNKEGYKVALLRIRSYRPFPEVDLIKNLNSVKAVGVFDRDMSLGYEGAIYTDVKGAIYGKLNPLPKTVNYIGGLGGRDVGIKEIKSIFLNLLGEYDLPKEIDSDVIFVGIRR